MPYYSAEPYIDPDNPLLEIYYDASGHLRRRSVRAGTRRMDEVQHGENARIVRDYVTWYTDRFHSLQNLRQNNLLYYPAHEALQLTCNTLRTNINRTQAEITRGSFGPAGIKEDILRQLEPIIAPFEQQLVQYEAELAALYAGNPYAWKDADGNWRVRQCSVCAISGSATFTLTELVDDFNSHCWLCDEHIVPRSCQLCGLEGNAVVVTMRAVLESRNVNTGRENAVHRRLCRECYRNANRRCEECSMMGTLQQPLQESADDGLVCNRCMTNATSRTEARIHGHGWVPRRIRWLKLPHEWEPATDSSIMYFGMEIEVENTEGKITNGAGAKIVVDTGMFYAERDSSINDGFEMVTYPFTWQWLQANADSKLEALHVLSSQGFRGFKTTTCGMHVHMSKAAMPHAQVYKMLRLIYANPRFIALVSRRELGSLNQWANPNLNYRPRQLTQVAKQKFLDGKYRALNLSKTNTAEVRIFKSTLSKNGVLMNLQFCKSALDYTRDCSIKEASDTRAFVEFVMGDKVGTYRHLRAFLATKNSQVAMSQLGIVDEVRVELGDVVGNKHYTPPEVPAER